MSDWLGELAALRERNEPAVLVTVAETKGSVPRETGTKMVVTRDACLGTIGGGNLEFKAGEIARQMLAEAQTQASLQRFPLGPSLGQCCGGVAVLLFEPIGGSDFHIVLFGAGHVGKALIKVLSALPCSIRWIDSRAAEFDRFREPLPGNVTAELSDCPEEEIVDIPPGSYILIMTHSHALDQAICEQALRRGGHAYCGLIGSASKLRTFRKRLLARGLSAEDLAGLTCPIGIDGISGKHPAEIAVAVAAQLLQVRERSALGAQDKRARVCTT